MKNSIGPIGVFDSGYGGLTILNEIRCRMPQYDYVYLGDNARTPYGTRSFDVVYEYSLQAVKCLFEMGCHLVILACNTASAKALRSIQQRDLPKLAPDRRVLGVIRPSVEVVHEISRTRHVGVLGTPGTVASKSYPIELEKISENNPLQTSQEACPMWVPLVENHEVDSPGADYFVQKNVESLMAKDTKLDTIILGCTHYPLLLDNIRKFVPADITLLNQGEVIAEKLEDYLFRHPEMAQRCSKDSKLKFYTTEAVSLFEQRAGYFLGEKIKAEHIHLKE